MFTCTLVVPAWRHYPAIVPLEIALLRLRQGRLVPGMMLIDRIPQGVLIDKSTLVLPIFIVRTAKQNVNSQIDIDQTGRDQFIVYYDAWRNEHSASPFIHRAVIVVT